MAFSDCEVQFNEKRKLHEYKIDKISSYKQHILQYFKFYSQMDLNALVLSTYSAKCFRRENFVSCHDWINVDRGLVIEGPYSEFDRFNFEEN